MVEHIFSVETRVNHTAVVTKKVKQGMKGPVNDIDIEVIPEYTLFNTGLKQFPGHAEITDLAGFGKLFKDFLMVFFEIIEKGRAHSLHLIYRHFYNTEKCLDGIVRLIDQFMSLLRCLVLIISDDLQQEGIFVLKTLINGTLGDAHLLGKRVHGHAFDSILSKQ